MRRTPLAVLALSATVTAAVAAPASAGCAIADPAGDATLASGAVLGGALDPDVPAAALDLVRGRADVTARTTTFSVRVADLASAATDSPSGIAYSWEVETPGRAAFVVAWSTPQSQGVNVYAGRTVMESTFVTRLPAPRLDAATDTVTFAVPTATLGLRAGARSDSVVRSWREVSVDTPARMLSQPSAADAAEDDGRPAWGRC